MFLSIMLTFLVTVAFVVVESYNTVPEATITTTDIENKLVREFLIKKFPSIQNKSPGAHGSLIKEGEVFNGGLNYDIYHNYDKLKGPEYKVQQCSRINDIKEKKIPGKLPIFTMMSVAVNEKDFNSLVMASLEYFTIGLQLDAQKLQIVTIQSVYDEFESLFKKFNIKVLLRDSKTAHEIGDGSGYFCPKGYPHKDGCGKTFSIEYKMHDGKYIELAEYLLKQEISFGLERIEMAVTNKYKYWNDYVSSYTQAISNNIKNKKLSSKYEYLLDIVN